MTTAESQKLAQNALRKLQQGKAAAALKSARAGIKRFPKEQNLLKIAGNAAIQLGEHRIAAKVFADLNKLNPGDPEVRSHLGLALVHAGQSDAAQRLITDWLADAPDNAEYNYLQAVIATRKEDFEQVVVAAGRALDIAPNMTGALALRGLAYFDQRKFDLALGDFERSNVLDPQKPETLLNIGLCHRAMRRAPNAIAAFEACLACAPDDLVARLNLANLQEQTGALAQAKESYHSVLRANPTQWEAIGRLVELNTSEENLQFEPQVRAALRRAKSNTTQEVEISLAYAQLSDALGDWPTAKKFYLKSNAVAAKLRPYDLRAAETQYTQTLALFPLGHVCRQGPVEAAQIPLFIIGQPRSGTTLMEMMISAHPDVFGLGEFGAIEDHAIHALSTGVTDPNAHARAFTAELPAGVRDYAYIVDKMPENYRYVGFLAEAFPNARFLHMQRDPRDVAFSMWKIHFSGDFLRYTSDLEWIAHAANTYKKYLNHWKSLFGAQILDVAYSELVQDPTGISKKVAEFCGLDWYAEMAAPEHNTSLVETASVVQVRQKIHKKALNTWEKDKDLFAPFNAALDPDLWPELDLLL